MVPSGLLDTTPKTCGELAKFDDISIVPIQVDCAKHRVVAVARSLRRPIEAELDGAFGCVQVSHLRSGVWGTAVVIARVLVTEISEVGAPWAGASFGCAIDANHTLVRLCGAGRQNIAVFGTDGRRREVSLLSTPFAGDTNHTFLSVLHAEGTLATLRAKARVLEAALNRTPFACEVHHLHLSVLGAAGALATPDTIARVPRAALIRTPLASEVHHLILSVLSAEGALAAL